jgi:hypothetical protein
MQWRGEAEGSLEFSGSFHLPVHFTCLYVCTCTFSCGVRVKKCMCFKGRHSLER